MAIHYIQKYDLSKYALKNFGNVVEICADTNAGQTLKFNKNGTVVSILDSSGNVPTPPVSLTATGAVSAPGIYELNGTAGGTITLPAATGSGAVYRFIVGIIAATNPYKIQVASATDYFRGQSFTATDNGSGAGLTWPTANTGTVSTESDTITLLVNGTTGGQVGDVIEIRDIKAAVFSVQCFVSSTGTEATPFSVAV
jgi:hypothetical protein